MPPAWSLSLTSLVTGCSNCTMMCDTGAREACADKSALICSGDRVASVSDPFLNRIEPPSANAGTVGKNETTQAPNKMRLDMACSFNAPEVGANHLAVPWGVELRLG